MDLPLETFHKPSILISYNKNSSTVISGRLPARPITRTGRLLHTAKKKVNGLPAPVDNPHVVIQLFRWRKRDIKAIHFSLSIQTCAQFCVNISLYFID